MRSPAAGAGSSSGLRGVSACTSCSPSVTRPIGAKPSVSSWPCGESVIKNCDDETPSCVRAIASSPSAPRVSGSGSPTGVSAARV